MVLTHEKETKWNQNTQEYHAGQEWNTIDNFVEDFSVTTNGLGTPATALAQAAQNVPFSLSSCSVKIGGGRF